MPVGVRLWTPWMLFVYHRFLYGTFGLNKYMATYIVEDHLVRINMMVILSVQKYVFVKTHE